MSLKKQLNGLEDNVLPGGWEEEFKKSIVEEDEKTFLKGFEMLQSTDTRSAKKRDFDQIRRDVLKTLNNCLLNRFQLDENLINITKPFVEFKEEANIREIHKIIGADLALSSLSLEYTELLQLKVPRSANLSTQIKSLLNLNESSNYECVKIILSRITACTPQSADVERLIKTNNLLKTAFRANLNLTTENKYMFVYFNMPPLEKWDPKKQLQFG